MKRETPPLPYPDFPLRAHPNGCWAKSIWNPRTRKSEKFYFGSWRDDPKGMRALNDPNFGWLARREAIHAGVDTPRVTLASREISLGELMNRFLSHKRDRTHSGELSLTTLGDYLREIPLFVAFLKPGVAVENLRPEHFSAYMRHLIEVRKLGRHSRKRVRAYVTAMLRFGATNNFFRMPSTGSDWIAPATDRYAMRQAKVRQGVKDYSSQIFSGEELDRMLQQSSIGFRALILIACNCGLGPADIGRLRWRMIDLTTGRLDFPRGKTGVPRIGYLWKKTRAALLKVKTLKHNRAALAREGEEAPVFLTRKNLPYYRESEVFKENETDGRIERKLVAVRIENAISTTFSRKCKHAGIEGGSFYRLRHTLKTMGKRARDSEALSLIMGHADLSIGGRYDHEVITFRRIKRVAKTVYRELWDPKRMGRRTSENPSLKIANDDDSAARVA